MACPGPKYAILPAIGIFLIVFGVIVALAFPGYIGGRLVETDHLGFDANGSLNAMTKAWAQPDYDMQLSLWVYSVQNPAAVIDGQKPNVVEKGPYVFVEKQAKTFSFTQNNTRTIYHNNKLYFFSQKLSCPTCLLSDNVTVPNLIFQKLVDAAEGNLIVRSAITAAIQIAHETVFIKVTVGDLLFNGYKDPLISGICERPIISTICRAFNVPDRIGLFYGQNNTDDGAYEINTGLLDPYQLGHLYSYNNMTIQNGSVYYGPQARMVNGSDGQLFHPFLDSDQKITIFVGQICRSIELEFNKLREFDDVTTYEYQPAKELQDVDLQRSLGFCNPLSPRYFNSTVVQPEKCGPKGLMDISSCAPGNPRIYISNPHFYDCPNALSEAIDGLKQPEADNDRTFVLIQPTAGVVVHAVRRSQINVGMLPGKIRFLSKMNPTIVPVIWLNETAHFDPVTKAQLVQLTTITKVAQVISVTVIGVGIFCIFLNLATFLVLRFYKKDGDEPLLSPYDNDEDVEQAQDNPVAGDD
uniref:CD36 family n=1 Tax=Panagrellus redivivus TaxID=6233 RepID=A0A7E4VT09_PANRE